ncbi:hypothetical protein ACE6ED_16905 [Paenibacillus sp. CN-4]|uniref:hypothetical protein n=1 Tax=Paenibacillus nanchangensis TaxID=3348343 RepID=UPI00397940D9
MKKTLRFPLLPGILLLALLLTSCYDPIEKVRIDTPAYAYGDTMEQKLNVVLQGIYLPDDQDFRGSLTIGRMTFDRIYFYPGGGLLSYAGKERTFMGQIYFDYPTLQYSIEITDPKLYELLTGEAGEKKSKLTISSPAASIEEAREINAELKEKSPPLVKE